MVLNYLSNFHAVTYASNSHLCSSDHKSLFTIKCPVWLLFCKSLICTKLTKSKKLKPRKAFPSAETTTCINMCLFLLLGQPQNVSYPTKHWTSKLLNVTQYEKKKKHIFIQTRCKDVCSIYRDGRRCRVGVRVRRRENVWKPDQDPRVENNTACVAHGGRWAVRGTFYVSYMSLLACERQKCALFSAEANFSNPF